MAADNTAILELPAGVDPKAAAQRHFPVGHSTL
jgi:hypothetical protein